MTISGDIVECANAAYTAPDRDGIRTLLAHILSGALGRQPVGHEKLVDAVMGETPADRATRWAARLYGGRGQDDFYYRGRCHVGVMVLPGLLALDVDDVFAPFAAGALALMMVSAPYGEVAQIRGLRSSAFFGAAGAAVGAASALGLSAHATATAMKLALGRSGAFSQAFTHHTDEIRHDVAVSAGAGVQSAQFAAAGVTAASEAIEGPVGWAAAHFSDPGAAKLRATLDTWSDGIRNIAVKPFAASSMIMPAIVLADELGQRTRRVPFTAARVYVHPVALALPGTLDRSPFATWQATTTSIVRCVAEGYTLGTLSGSFPESTAAVSQAEQVTQVIEDETLPRDSVRIEIETADGAMTMQGDAAAQLYPDWSATRGASDALAIRSDADPSRIAELLNVLARSSVSSSALRGVLGI
ncbi:MmgE/PrpD family protein [Streptomyces chartreusis]|uniref:MmgE/PrpD family protein n=1 Tax=Streptomyces chartreusis TaxID=1969 RepID=UPI0033D28CBF